MAENETLAELLRRRGEQLINLPTEATRFLTDPQAFAKLLGIDPNQRLSGFSSGFSGVPQKPPSDIGVVDPRNREYSKGYGSGEEMGMMTALASPLAPLAKPVGKALGKQAYEITEDMLAKQGMMPSVVPRKQTIEKEFNKVEPTISVQDRIIPITLHPVEARQGNKIEYVNTDKFENAFKKDETGYIGKGGTENAIGKRYQGVEEFLKTAPSMRASEVHVRPNGSVVFGDGRHRYAFLRDQGLDKIPISMDADSIKYAKKFGYID